MQNLVTKRTGLAVKIADSDKISAAMRVQLD